MVEEAQKTGDSLKQQFGHNSLVGMQQRSDGKFKSVSSIHGANGQAVSQASLSSHKGSVGVPEILHGSNARSSILIDDPPKSYRSGRQEVPMNFNNVTEFERDSEGAHVRSQGGIHSGRNQYFLDDKRSGEHDDQILSD